jgi:hypothetical protein
MMIAKLKGRGRKLFTKRIIRRRSSYVFRNLIPDMTYEPHCQLKLFFRYPVLGLGRQSLVEGLSGNDYGECIWSY